MFALFRLGQILKGKSSSYTITKQLQESVWLATSQSKQTVIIKSVRHFRLANERDVLKRFQARSPYLRPLIDEVVEPSDPPAIVLKHADDHLLNASILKRLTSLEIKYVARRILKALRILHGDGFVHTDVKPDNILINYGPPEDTDTTIRFSDVQLADCGSTVPADSTFAENSDIIGAPIWRSPEAQLQIGWGTPTDIWSFGAVLITLLYEDNFFLFKPDVPADHEQYELRIQTRQCQFFGPFPHAYQDISTPDALVIVTYIMQSITPETYKPFARIIEREVSKMDKEFVLKLMKLDPRDRPSAEELLKDEWFQN